MNWATIAPATRLYKGNTLFRWDDSPGLEHHCGTCQTPLHNARAKSTCIGKHVEPCYRFHQQLHFTGKSHECMGCNSSDEMHHSRHKEILQITRLITALDQASDTPKKLDLGPLDMMGSSRRGSHTMSPPTDASSETFSSERKLTRKERKKAKKSGNGSSRIRRTVETFSNDELAFISEAIHSTVLESKGAWEGTYDYTRKDQPIISDASMEIDEEAVEADEEEAFMDQSDAFSVKAPHDMTPRQRKIIKKFNTPINHSSYGGGSRKYTPNRDMGVDLYDGVDSKIFFRLGVEVKNPPVHSKARRDLVTKLIAAIKEDLDIISREQTETLMREEGFWRWAGKTAYEHIKGTRESFDWATGQKKGAPKREDSIDAEMPIIEGFEDFKIADTLSLPAKTLSKAPIIIGDFYAAKTTPKVPKSARRAYQPRPAPVVEEDDDEMAAEIKFGKTFAMVVKVLRPEPDIDVGFPEEDASLGWETVSRHKKTNSKSGTITGHKRAKSRIVTVR